MLQHRGIGDNGGGACEPTVYGRPVGLHVVLARELFFADVALKLWRYVAARQLMALQVTAAFEVLKTPGAAVLRPDAALFGQVKAQIRLALVVPPAVRTRPSAAYTRTHTHHANTKNILYNFFLLFST